MLNVSVFLLYLYKISNMEMIGIIFMIVGGLKAFSAISEYFLIDKTEAEYSFYIALAFGLFGLLLFALQ